MKRFILIDDRCDFVDDAVVSDHFDSLAEASCYFAAAAGAPGVTLANLYQRVELPAREAVEGDLWPAHGPREAEPGDLYQWGEETRAGCAEWRGNHSVSYVRERHPAAEGRGFTMWYCARGHIGYMRRGVPRVCDGPTHAGGPCGLPMYVKR